MLSLTPAASRLITNLCRQSALRASSPPFQIKWLKMRVRGSASPQPKQINIIKLETQSLNAVYTITKYRRAWIQGLLVPEQQAK